MFSSITKPPPTKLLPSHRLARRFLLSLLAFSATLHLLLPPPLPCFIPSPPPPVPTPPPPLPDFWNRSHSATLLARPCLNSSVTYRRVLLPAKPASRKYMVVVVSGGLNQQRNQIVDAVIIARIIGAVLVVPVLQVNQVWGDESEFADIFDERRFKERLRDDVAVVSSLPSARIRSRRVRSPVMPFGAGEDWVRVHYIPKLRRRTVFVLRAFDSRLSKDLNPDLQKLRCKVAFEALKFQKWIEEIAEKMVSRMSEKGPYLALHLRLEKDVWVRTGCPSGLGEEADHVLEMERATKPKLLTSRSKLTAQQRYLSGHCPLDASHLTRILNGLEVPKDTRIYWAGGEPFGGAKALEPLQLQFPNLYNKWSLAKPGELNDLEHKPSLLAALDYIVSLKSQAFMANHGGNMARSIQGDRTYKGYGTNIRPSKKSLMHLLMKKSLSDDEEKEIKQIQMESLNMELLEKNNLNRDVIAFPYPTCMCSKEIDN